MGPLGRLMVSPWIQDTSGQLAATSISNSLQVSVTSTVVAKTAKAAVAEVTAVSTLPKVAAMTAVAKTAVAEVTAVVASIGARPVGSGMVSTDAAEIGMVGALATGTATGRVASGTRATLVATALVTALAICRIAAQRDGCCRHEHKECVFHLDRFLSGSVGITKSLTKSIGPTINRVQKIGRTGFFLTKIRRWRRREV